MTGDDVIMWGFTLGVISFICVIITAASAQYAHKRISDLEKKMADTLKELTK